MKKILFLVVVINYTILTNLIATGTTGCQFLNIITSARINSLGNAFCGISSDVDMVKLNPAGLLGLKNSEISLYYKNYGEFSVNQGGLSFASPIPFGRIGLFFSFLGIPLDNVWEDGLPTDKNYSLFNIETGLGYQKGLFKDIVSLGIGVKYIHEDLGEKGGSSVGFDLGLLFDILKGNKDYDFRTGISFRNLGLGMKFDKVMNELPFSISCGLLYGLFKKVNFLADLQKEKDRDITYHFGIELLPEWLINLRAGYIIQEHSVFTLGIGVKLSFKGIKVNADYSFDTTNPLVSSHIVSLKFSTYFLSL